MDFWCHVAVSTELFVVHSVALLAMNRARKSKVYHPHVKVLVNHQVLKFQIAVHNSAHVQVM